METDFICRNGRRVIITLDEETISARACEADGGQDIGEIHLALRADADDNDYYFLTWAFLDKQHGAYCRQGIGARMLQLHRDEYGGPILARPHDGIVRDDGSHLTGNAPAFVAAMRERGLIVDDTNEGDEDETP